MNALTIECDVHLGRVSRGAAKELKAGPAPVKMTSRLGRVPRVTRLMALAIRFDEMIRIGRVKDHAELARLGHVTRARISQIMCLLHLAPDIQESLLFLPATQRGRAAILIGQLWPIATNPEWKSQRRKWHSLRRWPGRS